MTTGFLTNTLNVNVEGRVATIQFNRPQSLNAINVEMIKELTSNLKEISKSDEIDIVVFTGDERAFSSGGDIKTMLNLEGDENDFFFLMDNISELVVTIHSLPMLTISAISGAAAGLGFSLALATDHIIADEKSKLAMNFIGIGLIPDGGAHFFLEKRMGENKAKQLIWEGKVLTAEEAIKLNLIHEVAPNYKEALQARIDDWLSKPIKAMIKTKKILAEKNRPQLLKLLELEKNGQYAMRQTKDHQEGIAAFIEKRKPNFTGE
ncbi:enoyl-CoA hydratase [Robertmurraya massiliosenegalensis]|uniref:enoyl-CoA hydratase n=1 Tax=Robertmurraya massiliosenegalensis TaxID=1287657 RepID=UPI00031C9EE6|nr:enoyl-CoA hydratase [Robertmurraya massiliosenegalensis]